MTRSRYLAAFLDLIAWAELGSAIIAESDNGYDVLVGSKPGKVNKFNSYADHPHLYVKSMNSTAAGRYQILGWIFDHYKKQLGLPDFSPASQDAIAVQLIKERRALKDIESGFVESAIYKCASAWASFPKAGYGQPERRIEDLLAEYARALSTRRDT